jgi:hypothetical protein
MIEGKVLHFRRRGFVDQGEDQYCDPGDAEVDGLIDAA